MLDMVIGEKGSKERIDYDMSMDDYLIGLAIRRARESKNLTQQQLGDKVGVQKSRISSIEKGANLRLSTLRKVFTALGIKVNLDIVDIDTISLC